MAENPLKELMEEILALSNKKQEDYGSDTDPFANVRRSEELGIPAWKGALVRFGDKWQRIQQFANRGVLANESFEDSLKDAAVYALIALKLYREAAAPAAETAIPGTQYERFLIAQQYQRETGGAEVPPKEATRVYRVPIVPEPGD